MAPHSINSLQQFLGRQARKPVPEPLLALAEAASQRHDGVVAVLFYGSCLRSGRIDEGLADLYLLVDDYQRALDNVLQARLNRLLPPNVFYLETLYQGQTLRAKYAVVSLEDFVNANQHWFHSYFWARFAQPTRLVRVRDPRVEAEITTAFVAAVHNFVTATLPRMNGPFSSRELWIRGLELTYASELRSERPGTAGRLYDADPRYFDVLTAAVLQPLRQEADGPRYLFPVTSWERLRSSALWTLRKLQGKALSVLRLLKALLTFSNGMDYILWKIHRHSGVTVDIPPTLRRFPPLAAIYAIFKALRQGGFR
ncbi:MAG: hypothetical protein P8X63_09050 [Desulfuromonadaceae bacterium]